MVFRLEEKLNREFDEEILRKGLKFRKLSPKKYKILKEFYSKINSGGERLSLDFVISNGDYINKNSFIMVDYLDFCHSPDSTNKIVEKHPPVLGYSLSEINQIYAFLDSCHSCNSANKIVEKLPPVLGYTLSKIKQIYECIQ